MVLPTGNMIQLQPQFRLLTTTPCTVTNSTRKSWPLDAIGHYLILTLQENALIFKIKCSGHGTFISISTTCSRERMVLDYLLSHKTWNLMSALTLSISQNLELHIKRSVSNTLHGWRPVNQLRKHASEVLLLEHTSTLLLFVKLFISQKILIKCGPIVDQAIQSGVTH